VRQHAEILSKGRSHGSTPRAPSWGKPSRAARGAGRSWPERLYEYAAESLGVAPLGIRSYAENRPAFRADNTDARPRVGVAFERLAFGFETGKLVFHPGGWGAGEVTELAHDTASSSPSRLPQRAGAIASRLSAAVEIFDPLPEEDLRAIHFRRIPRT